jgi:glycosyltransferase involved in cell wall biosynthesis
MNANRALRICHLGKFYPPAAGGIETHVRTLARAQAELGADVEVLSVNHASASGADVTWRPLARSADVEEWDGRVRVRRLGRVGGLSRLELCPSLPAALRSAARRADVLHVHAPNVTMYLALAALGLQPSGGLGRPPLLCVTHHSDVIKQRHLGRLFAPAERRVLSRAARVFATSADYVAGSPLLSLFAHKVQVLPLGIALSAFRQPSAVTRGFAAELSARHGGPLWLCVGRLIYYKGVEVALRALRQVPGKLLIVGRGPMAAALSRLAVDLGVGQRVVWFDYLSEEELAGAYLAARALWFPSLLRSEAFGLVQVEAMASGCPVLNTFIPGSGVAWVSLDGVSGLTLPPGDADSLAAASRQLLEDPGLSRQLSAGGRHRAEAEFGDSLMARRSLDHYAQLLDGGCGSAARRAHEPAASGTGPGA